MAKTTHRISRSEVVRILGVNEDFVATLEQEEIVTCDAQEGYAPHMVERIRVCHSLHQDLGVNLAGLEVALQLLDTIHAQRSQFQEVLGWLQRELERRS